ncbi:MAG: Arginine/ornithine antiporter ArcD [uncultured Sulfurovum sp.]|uniref:Arginine/ornithine antiporter ArcD n=1 Tax=uncultured Sulfurovum sp. TaxID=269237 RepID=A0A6S6SRT0_9BACT|nr:MAG: Arginine/ornithine antiporter ArcD [uncultured Sulfurovum sp.]
MHKKINLQERLAGALLLCAIVPLAVLGYLLIVVHGLVGNADRIRQGVHALDHFVNATIFNGYAWESVSSHAWRERDKKWAKFIIWLTGKFQKNHCERCNKREQKIVDLIIKKQLHQQNIGIKKDI